MEAQEYAQAGPASRPEIDHSSPYSKHDRLMLALSHYYAILYQYKDDSTRQRKPNVSKLARDYSITESMLRRHLKNTSLRTLAEAHQDQQVLTVTEEKVLVDRLLFLDDFNVPADRDSLYTLAHALLQKRDPNRQLGRDWMYRFLSRHPQCRYVLVQMIATDRANAESWDIMDDFFGKVCSSFK
jgi:hypothetical protein